MTEFPAFSRMFVQKVKNGEHIRSVKLSEDDVKSLPEEQQNVNTKKKFSSSYDLKLII